ncbi:hypothetical protein, partial [Bacillus wiedmannii]|uniref:hypothetical protein n=1 Tax=Bacillus wiedmannii TaxID=1890302 RepID=UPI003D1FE93A
NGTYILESVLKCILSVALFESIANASEVPKRSPLDKTIPVRSVFPNFFILKPPKFVNYKYHYIEIIFKFG